MAAKKWNLSVLYGKKETTFGTDPDATGALYRHLKATEMSFQPEVDVVERPGLINDLVRLPHAIGARGGKVSFKLEVKGSGTPATAAAVAPEADEILETALGTVTRGTGSTIVSATTTALTVASGSGFSKWMMVLCDCGATYGWVPRFVISIAGNVLTLDRALPVAPANATAVHASNRYTRANSGHASMAFAAIRDGILYTFLGCKVDSVKVSGISARGTALLDVAYSVTDFNTTAKGSLPSTALTGITAVTAPVIKGSCFAVGGAEELAYGMDIDFGQTFAFQDSTCALGPQQGESVNAGLELVEAKPTGSVKIYYAASHMTDFAAGTSRSLAFACGRNLGNAWGFYAPNAQWLQPALENHNGMVGETMPFAVNDAGTDPEYAICLA